MKKILSVVTVLATLALATSAFAQFAGGNPFGAGDFVVVRFGDGTQPVTNFGQTVFLDEYSTSTVYAAGDDSEVTPVQSIAIGRCAWCFRRRFRCRARSQSEAEARRDGLASSAFWPRIKTRED